MHVAQLIEINDNHILELLENERRQTVPLGPNCIVLPGNLCAVTFLRLAN